MDQYSCPKHVHIFSFADALVSCFILLSDLEKSVSMICFHFPIYVWYNTLTAIFTFRWVEKKWNNKRCPATGGAEGAGVVCATPGVYKIPFKLKNDSSLPYHVSDFKIFPDISVLICTCCMSLWNSLKFYEYVKHKGFHQHQMSPPNSSDHNMSQLINHDDLDCFSKFGRWKQNRQKQIMFTSPLCYMLISILDFSWPTWVSVGDVEHVVIVDIHGAEWQRLNVG